MHIPPYQFSEDNIQLVQLSLIFAPLKLFIGFIVLLKGIDEPGKAWFHQHAYLFLVLRTYAVILMDEYHEVNIPQL